MAKRKKKMRLDEMLVWRGLAEERDFAQRLIMAGEVFVEGQLVTQPGTQVATGADLRLKEKPRFVSRGGEKLAAALDRFGIDLSGFVCADAGASTGGFTDCMLQAGAVRVYAVDVGYGQMAWELRQDERVVVMERINVRYLEELPEPVQFASIDVSFISLRLILPSVRQWLTADGEIVALVKPQFEAAREDVGEGGVVWDAGVHRQVLVDAVKNARSASFGVCGLMASPVQGPAGNVEFLLWARAVDEPDTAPTDEMIERALIEAQDVAG